MQCLCSLPYTLLLSAIEGTLCPGQDVLASAGSGSGGQGAPEQALAAEVAALRAEVTAALEAGVDSAGDPALAESLTRVTELLDELRSQACMQPCSRKPN